MLFAAVDGMVSVAVFIGFAITVAVFVICAHLTLHTPYTLLIFILAVSFLCLFCTLCDVRDMRLRVR